MAAGEQVITVPHGRKSKRTVILSFTFNYTWSTLSAGRWQMVNI